MYDFLTYVHLQVKPIALFGGFKPAQNSGRAVAMSYTKRRPYLSSMDSFVVHKLRFKNISDYLFSTSKLSEIIQVFFLFPMVFKFRQLHLFFEFTGQQDLIQPVSRLQKGHVVWRNAL